MIKELDEAIQKENRTGFTIINKWGKLKAELENAKQFYPMKKILDAFFREKAAEDNLNDYALCYSTLGVLHDRSNGIMPEHEFTQFTSEKRS